MRALVYEGPKKLNMRDLPIPKVEKGEVLVKVERVGICGSELGGYLGTNTLRKPPLVMGHEFSGEIADNSWSEKFKLGDRVTVNPLISCGKCSSCKKGNANLCPSRQLIGAGRPGAFAEYVTVPEDNVYIIPDDVSYDLGALVEPFACAIRISKIAKITAFDRLLIIGAGPIGLFSLQVAKQQGLKEIIVMDINEKRLEIVKELGGIPVSSIEQLEEEVNNKKIDVSIDAVGMEVTRKQCISITKAGGRVVFTGLHEEESNIQANMLIRNEIILYGSFGYNPIDFENALDWISDGRADLKSWNKLENLEDGKKCFDTLIDNPGKIAKFILKI